MKFTLLVTAILLVFQCTDKKSAKNEISLDSKWALTELVGFDSLLEGPKGAPILQVHLQDSTYSGHSGCNSYSGKFRLSGNKVHFYPALSTKMACVDNGLESAYFKALHNANGFSFEDQKLNLLNMGSIIATFIRKE